MGIILIQRAPSSEVIDARISAYIHMVVVVVGAAAAAAVCRYTARFTKMTDRLCLIGKKREREGRWREGEGDCMGREPRFRQR